ncbi:hypothetical protein [Rhodoplanes roseus]|uniref:Uncharacterized protein n=1 Tax=Rhodoplanes roseus TaxID=29409 RepID=A0A327L2J8_9BRAD|nr:hypothetical protein [Rhodoplanes roseus]RAI44701.1 hypothetical protein CH341_07745 [Rhodoplanes roseus]
MALPSWPSGLASRYQPQVEGFAYGDFVAPAVSTDVEDGPPIDRVGGQTLIERLPYKLRMSGAELAIFRAFWRDDIARGTGRFTMSVPIDGTYTTRTVKIDGGRWSAPPASGDLYDLSFTLLVFPAA